jgi:DNA-binding transcriptional ArsR family regulator
MEQYVLMYAPTHASPDDATQPTGEQARAAADVLRLLADPTRLQLLAALVTADRDVTELTALTDVPRPAVSQHLGKLRLGGLVESRAEGRRRIYAVRNGHVRRLLTETLAHADHLVSGLPDHE